MSSFASASDFEVRIFDPTGRPLRDIRVAPRYSFVLNDVGDCTFTISTSDPAFSEGLIQFGNYVVVNHTHLPSWVGVIDPSNTRTWNYGNVDVNCLSAEHVFDLRIQTPTPMNGTAGEVFTQLLANINLNSVGAIPFRPGYIMNNGRSISYPLMGRAGDIVRWLTKKAKCEYTVTPDYDKDGNLVLVGNLYQQKGIDTQLSFNTDNTEMAGAIMTEDGDIWNDVTFMTDPQNGGKNLIVGSPQRDEESIARYGLRQYLGVMTADDRNTLDTVAAAWLMQYAYPKQTVTPAVLNVNDFWKSLDTGNWYTWDNHLAGFTNGQLGATIYVRLSGYEVATHEGKINAVVDRYDSRYTWRQIWNQLYG